MAYNENIPQPNDIISNSQNDLLNNFQAIKQLIDVNHGTFSAGDEGKHKFLQMPEQGAAPATLADEAALYAAVGANSGTTELVFRREDSANPPGGQIIAFTEGLLADDGWTRLPSGLLIKWGSQADAAGVGNNTVAFVGPVFTTVFQIFLTIGPRPSVNPAQDINAVIYLGSFNTMQFTYYIWRRDTVNTAGTNVNQTRTRYLAVGI